MTSGRRTEPCVGPIARSRSACKELRNRPARRIGRRSVPPLTGFRSAQKRNPGRERPRVWPRYAAQRPFGVVHALGSTVVLIARVQGGFAMERGRYAAQYARGCALVFNDPNDGPETRADTLLALR